MYVIRDKARTGGESHKRVAEDVPSLPTHVFTDRPDSTQASFFSRTHPTD